MNTQWMTTLLKNFGQVQSQVRQELATRGLRLSAADLAALVEEIAPAASRATLSSALDLLKPFSAGLGFRVSRLTDTQIELVIPNRSRNLDEQGFLHESVMVAGAIEAAKLLWLRHAPLGEFSTKLVSMEMRSHKSTSSEGRIRLELLETTRENLLSQLRQKRETFSDLSLRIVDEGEQEVAQLELQLRLQHQPVLEAPEG